MKIMLFMVVQYLRGLWINFSKGAVMLLGNHLVDKSEVGIVIHKLSTFSVTSGFQNYLYHYKSSL
jgi:hypothetical protein